MLDFIAVALSRAAVRVIACGAGASAATVIRPGWCAFHDGDDGGSLQTAGGQCVPQGQTAGRL